MSWNLGHFIDQNTINLTKNVSFDQLKWMKLFKFVYKIIQESKQF